jgi:hypothetical protein
MRRALASLLLVFWIAGTCAPLLAQSVVPACCRIDGKHHCTQHLPGSGFHAATCESYQHATALTSTPVIAPETGARVAPLDLQWSARLLLRSPDLAAFCGSDIQKRGPPLA